MTDNLLPINTIIKLARMEGVDFGFGDPKVHLTYLTKLRLLPQAIRRKIGNKISGCYPESVIASLKRISDLKNKGLSYSQIRLQNEQPAVIPAYNNNSTIYLIIGLILGYLLSTAKESTTVANLPAPQSVKLTTQSKNDNQPIYVIALPEKNLYKLGTVNLGL